MKVRLTKPVKRAVFSSLVVQDKGKRGLAFVNASKGCIVVESKLYRQTFTVWQKEQAQ